VFSHLTHLKLVPDFNGVALDFGCGVGRLTQPLSSRFSSCVGIDISQQMIEKAEAMNANGRCRYIVSADQHLPFADASVSFIYSNIVLQHMPAELAKGYLREFVRILANGGILVFGVQERFVVTGLSMRLDQIRGILRVRSRIRKMLGRNCAEMQMHCLSESDVQSAIGDATIVDSQLTNTAAKDFNGHLEYLTQAPESGYISKQYCVVKKRSDVPQNPIQTSLTPGSQLARFSLIL
jgi:SAM-dependent methyltransferase